MEKEPLSGVQDEFLNGVRREKALVTLYLLNGLKLQGRVRSFDKFAVLVDINGSDHLIFKHAISTIVAPRPSRDRTDASSPHSGHTVA